MKASEFWLDPNVSAQYVARTEGIKAIIAEQTARFGAINQQGKKVTVQLGWIESCSLTDAACSNDCSTTGAEPESETKDYELTLCREVKFKVARKKFRNNLFNREEVIADQMLKAGKILDEYWDKVLYTRLNSFAGVNAYDSDLWVLAGSPTGAVTQIAKSNLTVDVIPELILAAYHNYMQSPFLLSGSLMYTDMWKAALNALDTDKKGVNAQWDAMRKYFDLQWLDTQNSPNKVFYQIDRGAVAFKTHAWYQAPEEDTVDMRFAIPSRNIPGVMYDVIHTVICDTDEKYDHFRVQTLGDIWNGPELCENNRTGVYLYQRVADT